MKKWKNLLLIGALCAMCALPVHAADEVQPPTEPTPTEAPVETPTITPEPEKPAVKNGWVTLSGGRKRYYKNGTLLKGMQRIGKHVYFFNRDTGVMLINWRTIDGKRYYFGKDGARREGVCRIDGKYYLFDKNSVRRTADKVKISGVYYFLKNGYCEAWKKGSVYYRPNGKKMSQSEGYEYETLLTARKIVSEITNNKMSESTKLLTCFKWVMAKYYKIDRKFTAPAGWTALYANDHFKNGRGNCISDACAFGYLAKALGYKNIYICLDSRKTDGTGHGHSWTEIDGRVYDPLFAQAKSFSANYGVRYGTYKLSPLMKAKIA